MEKKITTLKVVSSYKISRMYPPSSPTVNMLNSLDLYGLHLAITEEKELKMSR